MEVYNMVSDSQHIFHDNNTLNKIKINHETLNTNC